MRQYWRFYWPLTVMGLGMVLAIQFQNGVLARFPDAVTELAVFALAYSTYGFFNAALNFTAQLSNVYARSPFATRRTYRFVIAASLVLMTPLAVIAHTAVGTWLLTTVYGIDAAMTDRVKEYLVLLAPVVLIATQRSYFNGLLIQAQLTGWVTTFTAAYLTTLVAGLVLGFTAGLAPAVVVVGSEAVAILVQLAGILWAKAKLYRPPAPPDHEQLSYAELSRFFVPVSATGVMFALSRPILYAFVSRTPQGVLAIAALRVAFDLSVLFQQAANQFRHFFVTLGLDDLPGKRAFMALVTAALTILMLLYVFTPLSDWVWRDLMAIPAEVRALSLEAFLVLSLMPTLIVWRNYYHGQLMVLRRTGAMAAGGIVRVAGMYVLAQLAFSAGWLDHIAAAVILILGFLLESLVAALGVRRQNGHASRENATAKI